MPDPVQWDGGMQCPVSFSRYPRIMTAHGSGGRLTRDLIEEMFRPVLKNPFLDQRHDGAVLEFSGSRFAVTTDSHVVHPIFFPGGDIGRLSVIGTVNDLAMCGAVPRWLTLSLILEEGLETEILWKVIQSIGRTAAETGVQVVTGDTKVIDRSKGGEIFINTTGFGTIGFERMIAPPEIRPGDAIILSGDVGRHGIAVLSAREHFFTDNPVQSDCTPLHRMVIHLLDEGTEIHCMRDCTRGGLASALAEIAEAGNACLEIHEDRVPVHEPVQGACELLGLDPLYVANEGCFVLFVPEREQERTLSLLHSHPEGREASQIGHVKDKPGKRVIAVNSFGGRRILDLLTGDQLPRIC